MAGQHELIIRLVSKKKEISTESFLTTFVGALNALTGCSGNTPESEHFGLNIKRISISSPGDIVLTEDENTNPDFALKKINQFGRELENINLHNEFSEDLSRRELDGYESILKSINNGIKSFSIVTPKFGEKEYTSNFAPKLELAINQEKKQSYYEWTSIEGTLTDIGVTKTGDKPRFVIFHSQYNKSITCYIKNEEFDYIKQKIELKPLRISVLGKVFYNKRGIPISVQVESFEDVPIINKTDWNNLDGFNITNKEDTLEYIEKIRYGDQ